MRILLDHCVNWRLRRSFPDHQVDLAAERGWEEFQNGDLLLLAGAAGYDVVITVDRKMRYQQNPRTLPVAVIVLIPRSLKLSALLKFMPQIELELARLMPNTVVEIR